MLGMTIRIFVTIAIIGTIYSCRSHDQDIIVLGPENVNTPSPAPSPYNHPKTVTGGRDLRAYDFGGRKGCGNVPYAEYSKCEASIQDARNFIWNHWIDRRRGYVVITMASDDAQSDAHIFIEPDETGQWRVAWTWKRIFGFPTTVAGRIDAGPDIYSIERRVQSETEVGCVRSGTLHLSFVDAVGKEVFCL